MAKTVVNLSDSMAQFVVKANQISTHVGDTTQLTTIEDSDLVGAINELVTAGTTYALDSDVGARASLITDDKANLVTAINEIKTQALGIDSNLSVYLRSDVTDTKTAGDLVFSDNVKAAFGDASDLQIYHDGLNSYIAEGGSGTGSLKIKANNLLAYNNSDVPYFQGITGGTFRIYHNGLTKLATTATGVDVTGALITDGLTVDTNTLHVDAANNRVGIGTSSPSGKLNLATGASTACELRLTSNNTGSGSGDRGRIVVYSSRNDGTAYEAAKIEIDRSSGTADEAHMLFATNGGSGNTERMRVDASGNVLVGTTTSNYSATNGFGVIAPAAATYAFVSHPNGTANSTDFIAFSYAGTRIGNITQASTSGVAYNTTSDVRLKQDIEPLQATDMLMAMNPVSYHWKVDPQGPKSIGFIAQEMQKIMPEAVSGIPDGEDMMGMDYGRITPVLVAALQDAHRKIEQLEKRIADMENA